MVHLYTQHTVSIAKYRLSQSVREIFYDALFSSSESVRSSFDQAKPLSPMEFETERIQTETLKSVKKKKKKKNTHTHTHTHTRVNIVSKCMVSGKVNCITARHAQSVEFTYLKLSLY